MTASLKLRYKNFCEFMENNTKGVEIGIYSVSGLLFAVSYYKIRPITKFGKPSDIPRRFITEKIVQNGTVKSIEANQIAGPLLRIDHKPPINLFFTSNKTVPVKIFGVDINANGYSWLQSVTVNQKVQFYPLIRNETNAECQIKLLQDPALHAKTTIDLAESLISIGFAKLSDNKSLAKGGLSRDEQIQRYKQRLTRIQAKAKRERNGIWSSIPRPIWPLNVLQKQAAQLVYKKVLPEKHRLPELVR